MSAEKPLRPKKNYVCLPSATNPKMPKILVGFLSLSLSLSLFKDLKY